MYLRARYYQPAKGRFLTRDTYTGEEDEPESLHLYAYCGNDGVNAWDPSGHDAVWLQYKYAAARQGHTGLLIQDSVYASTWYYFFWGPQKTDYKILFAAEPKIVLEKVEGKFTGLRKKSKKLRKSIYKKTNTTKYYTEKLTGVIYFRGDFSLTYLTCALLKNSVNKNKGEIYYNLFSFNCLQVSIKALSNGIFKSKKQEKIIKDLKMLGSKALL